MIYIECYPDKALLKSLTDIPRRGIIHGFKGKGEICNQLMSKTGCVAMVDEDPESAQPKYVREATIEEELVEAEIRVLYHKQTNNRLIVLRPRLENWILKSAEIAGVDVRTYKLPNNWKKLHEEINLSLEKFESLLDDLKKSSNRLKTLRTLIQRYK